MSHPPDCDCEFCRDEEAGLVDGGYCADCGGIPGSWGLAGCDCDEYDDEQ